MKYECLNCKFYFERNDEAKKKLLKKAQYYTCPNCGEIILDEEWTKNVKEKLRNSSEEITPEKIKELLNSEKIIMEKANHSALGSVKDYIIALFNLLKDPKAAIAHKIIAATAIIYVISPLDIIPDPIPVIGFTDDVLMVLAAVSIIGVALHQYLKDNGSSDWIMIYKICQQKDDISKRYIEEKPLRVWSLLPNELDNYNLRIINDYLVEAPCNYVNHPYLWKTLIPIHSYDKLIEKALLDEEIKLFAALGAKKIKAKHQEIHSSKFDAQIDIKTINNVFDGKEDVKKKKLEYSACELEYEFNESRELSYDVINELLWTFTIKNNFDTIFFSRIRKNMVRTNYTAESSTLSFLDIQLRNKIMKNDIGIKFSGTGAIYRKSEYQIEFYPLDMSEEESISSYNKILELINKRKDSLKREY